MRKLKTICHRPGAQDISIISNSSRINKQLLLIFCFGFLGSLIKCQTQADVFSSNAVSDTEYGPQLMSNMSNLKIAVFPRNLPLNTITLIETYIPKHLSI